MRSGLQTQRCECGGGRADKWHFHVLHLPMEELLMKFSEAFCKRRHDAVDLGAKDGRAKFQKTAWG